MPPASLGLAVSYCASSGVTDLTQQVALAYSSSSSSASSSRSSACAAYASRGSLGPAELECTLTLCEWGFQPSNCLSIRLRTDDIAANGAVQSWAIVTASTDYNSLFLTTSYANASLSSAAPSTVTAYITQSLPIQTTVPPSDDRPSTGVIAGIAVGATIGVVIVLSLVAFFVWRLRRKRKSMKNVTTAGAIDTENRTEKSQLHSDDYKPSRKELEGSKVLLTVREIAGVHEIETQDLSKVRTEMSANEIAASELDTPDRARLSPTTDSSTLLGSSVRSHGGR